MKRHLSLVPLSREHHGALILAQLIKRGAPVYKGLPTTNDDKIPYALDYYRTHLQKHFEQEESMLSKIDLADPLFKSLAAEIVEEHQLLHRLFRSLQESPDTEAALNILGNELEAHIRKEERVLFPLIEKSCTEEVLKGLTGFSE